MNQQFLKHVNKYHPIEWLIKSIKLDRNDLLGERERLLSSTEFLIIMSDISLRISQNNCLRNRIPITKEYMDFINLYISTQSQTQSELLKKYGVHALPLITLEQIKFKYPHVNLIGRLALLYSNYEDEIIKITKLKIIDIITILLAIMAFYDNKNNYIFIPENISIEEVEELSLEKISMFLEYFSIDVQGYKRKLKLLGVDKRQLYSFRLLEKYPIINFDTNQYIMPSFENLLYSITSNMNIHLLSHYSEQNRGKEYHDSLGNQFEDYVKVLTKEVFTDITEASEIVPKNTKNAEFVINYNDIAIVVEVKKIILHRDTPFENNIEDFDKLIKRHILKAYEQIETTFKYLDQRNKIGIIVTLGDISIDSVYLRGKYSIEGIEFLDNILIVSIGNYEALLANSPDDILEIIKYSLEHSRKDIILSISTLNKNSINPFLSKEYDELLRKLD